MHSSFLGRLSAQSQSARNNWTSSRWLPNAINANNRHILELSHLPLETKHSPTSREACEYLHNEVTARHGVQICWHNLLGPTHRRIIYTLYIDPPIAPLPPNRTFRSSDSCLPQNANKAHSTHPLHRCHKRPHFRLRFLTTPASASISPMDFSCLLGRSRTRCK